MLDATRQTFYFLEHDPNLSWVNISRPKRMFNVKKIMIVSFAWMILGIKLLSPFSMSAITSFLKYLRCRQTSGGKVENIQRRFGSPSATQFLTLRDPCVCGNP